jgi:DNA-binding CsgD family transcriptional regulator
MELPPVRYATASDGVRIAYMRWPGESPPFLAVYVPCSPSMRFKSTPPTDRSYAGAWRRFARGRSWVMFDWRGTGLSDRITGPLTNDDLVGDLAAVTDAIGEPVDGWVAARACLPVCVHAAGDPNVYRSLWLRAPGVNRDDGYTFMRNRPGWEADYTEHLRLLLLTLGVSQNDAPVWAAAYAADVPQESYGAYLEAAEQVDLTDFLPRIASPAWITAGGATQHRQAASVASLMPDASLSVWAAPEMSNDLGDWTRDDWDRHLGARLGSVAGIPAEPNGVTVSDLSPRESAVLVCLALGNSNAQIATQLILSTRTVERHVRNIYTKLNVHNRVEAANWAREHGVS